MSNGVDTAQSPSCVPDTPGESGARPRRRALLVAHGIGQQHPFQTLDNMSQGLRRAMQDRGEPTVSMTHIKRGADCPFGHYIRLQSRSMTLDIYEYFWASKTQGKATFLDAVRWVLVTAVTPLQRLAFNVPLIIERAAGAGSRMGFWRSLTSEMFHELLRLDRKSVV